MRHATLALSLLLALATLGQNACDQLVAGFSWSTIPASGAVQFSNGTTGTGFQTTWQWSFGDGTDSNEAQPDHLYAAPGTYEVCLVAISVFETQSGLLTCVDDHCAVIEVGGGGDPCDELEAGFTYTSIGNGVVFSNTTTGLGQGTQWQWSFGDGTSSNQEQPDHTFPGPGTYNVCLTVITIFNNVANPTCVDEYCATVTIGGGNNLCDELEAGFTYATAGSGNGVIFSNGTTGTGFQTTWMWYFGDGTTSSNAQPDHLYAEPGTYNVCLVATTIFETSAGLITCVDEYCAPVVIGGEPEECDPSFALEIDSEPSSAGFILTASTNIPNGGITWNFANGLVLFGSSIQVSLASVVNIELCITAWYQPVNSTDTCWVTVCGLLSELGFAVGLNETGADGALVVSPNPATDMVLISGAGAGNMRVRVFGMDGRMESETNAQAPRARIDISGLAPGLKLVEISVNGRTERRQLVKE